MLLLSCPSLVFRSSADRTEKTTPSKLLDGADDMTASMLLKKVATPNNS